MSSFWIDNNYKELRTPGMYPASGLYTNLSNFLDTIVSMIQITTDSSLRGINRYDIKNDKFFSGSISRESVSVVKLF